MGAIGIGRSIVHLHVYTPNLLDAEASYQCRRDFASSIKSDEEPGCRGEDWLADQGSLPPWTFNRQDTSICDARLFARWRPSPPSLLWSSARSPTPCTRLTSPSFQSRFLTHGSRTTQPAEGRDYPDPDRRDHRSAAPPPAWHDC